MVENWWYDWRAITFDDGSFEDLTHLVRYDADKLPVEQHLVLHPCLNYENFGSREDGYLISVKGLTNNKSAFAQFMRSDKFDDWYDRIMWYVKRQYKTASERMKIDGITVLCLILEHQGLQTILCGREDDCFCENLPSLDWLRILPDIMIHSHVEPICVCEFPTEETKSRTLKLNQSINIE
jgi:hypothetical protein